MKLLSTHFHKEAHFQRMQEALRKVRPCMAVHGMGGCCWPYFLAAAAPAEPCLGLDSMRPVSLLPRRAQEYFLSVLCQPRTPRHSVVGRDGLHRGRSFARRLLGSQIFSKVRCCCVLAPVGMRYAVAILLGTPAWQTRAGCRLS